MTDDHRAALERAYEHALQFHDARRRRPPQALAAAEALWALSSPTAGDGGR